MGPSRLSSQCDHWTREEITALPVLFKIVYYTQLLLQFVAGIQTRTGLKPPTFRSEGESTNQYTLIESLQNLFTLDTFEQKIYNLLEK